MKKPENIQPYNIQPYYEFLQWLYKEYGTDKIEILTHDTKIDLQIKKIKKYVKK